MKASFYLVVASTRRGSVRELVARRVTKGRPSLDHNEIAVRMSLEISETAFDPIEPDVSVTIPDGWVTHPTAEVTVLEPPSDSPAELG